MRRYQIIPIALAAIISAGGGGVVGYAIGTTGHDAEVAVGPIHHTASTSPPALGLLPVTPYENDNDYTNRPRYRIGTDHGFVAVFYTLDETLKERTRTPESTLSQEERERLAGGIYIYTEEQLVRVLQDYGS